jgi:thioredoxin reductase (NADPH)
LGPMIETQISCLPNIKRSTQNKQIMIETDIIIIGAGPVGLFTVFEAGLLKLRCHLIDSLPQPGGQCSEIYPKKPIYDIPGFPSVLAGDLITNLMEQIAPFKPGFTLGEAASTIDKQEDGSFIVTTVKGTRHKAPVVMIAGGLGVFEPRKPPIDSIGLFEEKGVDYIIKDPEVFRNKKCVIAGGGDSALDWSIYLAENNIASEVTLVHRSASFRGHLDSVQKVIDMAGSGKISLITEAEVTDLKGGSSLEEVIISHSKNGEIVTKADHFIPLFGLKPSLGPIADWGLEIEKSAIKVDTLDYSTNIPGIYAIGDVNTYENKLKLILCGFHEGTLAVQSAFARIHPDKKNILKYTTVNGVNGF